MDTITSRPFVIPSLILGFALIVSSALSSITFYRVKSFDNTIVTTGSAKENVLADQVKWQVNSSRIVPDTMVSGALGSVSKDVETIRAFFISKGLTPEEMTLTPVFTDEYYGPERDAVRRVSVRQSLTVNSSKVDTVRALAESTASLVSRGVTISPQMPEYYVSSLPELRVRLLGAAIRDARARANEIASSTDRAVGNLKSSSSGVVQVLAPNSNEVADFGQYDTATIDKEVMVTVRATFFVK
jgi:uncharacterized protein